MYRMGQWLWCSQDSSNFQHHRYAVGIQASAFCIKRLLKSTKRRKKGAGNGRIKKCTEGGGMGKTLRQKNILETTDKVEIERKRGRQGRIRKTALGNGCVAQSVCRAVASDIRGPRFKYSHRQKLIFIEHLLTVNCILNRQNKEKDGRVRPIFLK